MKKKYKTIPIYFAVSKKYNQFLPFVVLWWDNHIEVINIYSYETANGIKREETSYNKVLPKGRSMDSNEGGENDESDEIHVQIGSYSYTAPDGTLISVR